MRRVSVLKLKVFTSECDDYEVFTFEPPPGKIWFDDDYKIVMSDFIHKLKDHFKGFDFQVTRKGPGRYNAVPFALERQVAESTEEQTWQQP